MVVILVYFKYIKRFEDTASVAFHVETGHLIFSAKQVTDFYMKRNTNLKSIKQKMRGNLI